MAQNTAPVSGVWLRKNFAHLGGEIELLVETGGAWRKLGTWPTDDGCISHIFEPAGILGAPVDHPPPDTAAEAS